MASSSSFLTLPDESPGNFNLTNLGLGKPHLSALEHFSDAGEDDDDAEESFQIFTGAGG
ncbi:hypothetical protein HDU93_006456, partial [Gonapodya sp. JEL0774]